jgi:hypothetical protein
MVHSPVLRVDCPIQIHHPGSMVDGQVHIDLTKVRHEHLEECIVSLRGELNT